jgi:hypothetical protein
MNRRAPDRSNSSSTLGLWCPRLIVSHSMLQRRGQLSREEMDEMGVVDFTEQARVHAMECIELTT